MGIRVVELVAIVSTAVCIFLWFREVRRIMTERKNTVESAASQLAVHRGKALKARNDVVAAAVFARSERIYRQAVDLYNQTLRKPWNYLPARLMGFSFVE